MGSLCMSGGSPWAGLCCAWDSTLSPLIVNITCLAVRPCLVPWCGLQVRAMVVACPAILAEKPLELQRKVDFLKQVCWA